MSARSTGLPGTCSRVSEHATQQRSLDGPPRIASPSAAPPTELIPATTDPDGLPHRARGWVRYAEVEPAPASSSPGADTTGRWVRLAQVLALPFGLQSEGSVFRVGFVLRGPSRPPRPRRMRISGTCGVCKTILWTNGGSRRFIAARPRLMSTTSKPRNLPLSRLWTRPSGPDRAGPLGWSRGGEGAACVRFARPAARWRWLRFGGIAPLDVGFDSPRSRPTTSGSIRRIRGLQPRPAIVSSLRIEKEPSGRDGLLQEDR